MMSFVSNCVKFLPSHMSMLALRPSCVIQAQKFSSSTEPKLDLPEVYSLNVDDTADEESLRLAEEAIQAKRNKSRLNPQHYNILHGKPPYSEGHESYHFSVKYKRRTFGRYGRQSNVDIGKLWPTANEIQASQEYETVVYPHSFHEMVAIEAKKKQDEKDDIDRRQRMLEDNLRKLETWKKEVQARAAKKAAEVAAAKAKKDALIEEVRRHFGYKVDERDSRFQEMLKQKERDQKKKAKEARRKEKEEKLYATILGKRKESTQ